MGVKFVHMFWGVFVESFRVMFFFLLKGGGGGVWWGMGMVVEVVGDV